MKVKYESNNSGGRWWLSDEDWRKLEAGGWKVFWFTEHPPLGSLDKSGRWLGALAKKAEGNFPSMRKAVLSFEEITGQDVTDEGCNCCGPPHFFSCETDYGSGPDLLRFLYKKVPNNLREATRELNES